jgi:hypothetical protein
VQKMCLKLCQRSLFLPRRGQRNYKDKPMGINYYLFDEGAKSVVREQPNKGMHRSARSEFRKVPSVPLARPVMPGSLGVLFQCAHGSEPT